MLEAVRGFLRRWKAWLDSKTETTWVSVRDIVHRLLVMCASHSAKLRCAMSALRTRLVALHLPYARIALRSSACHSSSSSGFILTATSSGPTALADLSDSRAKTLAAPPLLIGQLAEEPNNKTSEMSEGWACDSSANKDVPLVLPDVLKPQVPNDADEGNVAAMAGMRLAELVEQMQGVLQAIIRPATEFDAAIEHDDPLRAKKASEEIENHFLAWQTILDHAFPDAPCLPSLPLHSSAPSFPFGSSTSHVAPQ